MYDYIIIGSGIIGSFIARELAQYQVRVLVLEKENDFVNGQTVANSAILHAGYDPLPGSLKARLCVEGNKLYSQYSRDLKYHILQTGALVVAHHREEENKLLELYKRSQINQVVGATIISGTEALQLEPHLDPSITMALSLPSTKVISPWEVAFNVLENAWMNGVELRKNAEVIAIDYQDNHYLVKLSSKEVIQTNAVINAAGVQSEEIARMVETDPEFTIIPRRGEYFVLDKRVKGWLNHVIYPLPTLLGKGVLIVPQVHGNILLGPTSILQEDKESVATTKEGLTYIKDSLKHLATNIPYHQVIRQFAGVRASSSFQDFYIQESKTAKKFYHVAGIDSPGLTSAPAIARYLVEEVIKIQQPRKDNFIPSIPERIKIAELTDEEKCLVFRNNSQYGNIICKCEHITEAEVVEAIKGPLGSDTIKGIKKRVRAGAGLCQGGYCEHQVLKIIARETGVNNNEVNYDQLDSSILIHPKRVIK